MNFIENESVKKLRGGYYTPRDLADFLTRWIGAINPHDILEPSCGDGVFFRAIAEQRLYGAALTGFELDAGEAKKAASVSCTAAQTLDVRAKDFLGWALERLNDEGTRFDAAVGNPPFVRYQYLPTEFQTRAKEVFERLGLQFTKRTNAWVPFVLASVALLRPGGRLAMVVPAEVIHVLHAQSVRSYLGSECRRVVIIDPQELWFEETLQGAVLLLAEKQRTTAERLQGLGIYSVRGREFLTRDPEIMFQTCRCTNGRTVEGKWTRAVLDESTRAVLDESENHVDVHQFTDVAEVDVGIVTGANKYFLVTDGVVERFRLEKWAHPMFGRSEHCPGVIYDQRQHEANAKNGNPTNFIWFRIGDSKLGSLASSYVRLGEEQKLHTRYKCRIRNPWYTVPSVYATEIGMLKRSHDAPRLILNSIRAYTTDTSYRIRSKNVNAATLVSCFMNPLTALSAELEGRYYGGGVLELVPSEIERLAIPLPAHARYDVEELDAAVREKPTDQLLATHGMKVLGGLGLSAEKQAVLFEGWMHLRNRRQRNSQPDRTPSRSQVGIG